MNTYTKYVRKQELFIYKLAEQHDLAPKLISYNNVDDEYEMVTEKYTHTLK
jgi:hypothetical protein